MGAHRAKPVDASAPLNETKLNTYEIDALDNMEAFGQLPFPPPKLKALSYGDVGRHDVRAPSTIKR